MRLVASRTTHENIFSIFLIFSLSDNQAFRAIDCAARRRSDRMAAVEFIDDFFFSFMSRNHVKDCFFRRRHPRKLRALNVNHERTSSYPSAYFRKPSTVDSNPPARRRNRFDIRCRPYASILCAFVGRSQKPAREIPAAQAAFILLHLIEFFALNVHLCPAHKRQYNHFLTQRFFSQRQIYSLEILAAVSSAR